MTQTEIEQVLDSCENITQTDILQWLKDVLAKVNEWKSKI